MPCNTAHFYYEELRKSVKIPFLSIVELTLQSIRKKYPQKKKAGLIGTTGTVKSRIYNQSKNMTTEVIYPTDQLQEETMRAIYQTKAGRNSEAKETVIKVATHLIENGVEIIICGCTEISLLLNREDISVPLVDPLQILAEVAVEYAKGKK